MFDIVFVKSFNELEWKKIKDRFPLAKKTDSFKNAQRMSLTEFVWIIPDDVVLSDNFDFEYVPDQWSQDYVHVFRNGENYDGVVLIPKKAKITDKEFEHRFFVNKKEVDLTASIPRQFDLFLVDSYNEYLTALETSTTEMFWISSRNISHNTELINNYYIPYSEKSLRQQTHAFVHQVKDQKLYNGLFLCSKHRVLTEKEITFRFPVNRIEHDIIGSGPAKYDVFEIDTYAEYLRALETSTTELFWMSSRNISAIIPDLYFTHDNEYDRKQNHAFIHQVKDRQLYNGLFLCSKHRPLTEREVEYRHIVNRKEWDIVGSGPVNYDHFYIETYDEYLFALKNSKTELFWADSYNIKSDIPDLYFTHDNEYDRKHNHNFLHHNGTRNGLFLLSKHSPVTQKEIDHRFIVNAKEWDIVGSGPVNYEIFHTKTYDDYLDALKNSKTEMFWIIPDYVNPAARFKFDTYFTHDQNYERTINHAYLNGKYHDGIILCSKRSKFSKREFDYKFIAHKKEINIVISTPQPFDIVFISYQEPNADEYYKYLIDRFPKAKRVHGVKGIHQAHIEAARLCETDMFWIVDGDALIDSNFKFDYQVARWDKETVHVWRSVNPINDLVYGYGGVKLFPRELTLNMDVTKPDMTTSISSKFKAVQDISNVTGFNTDPFNTWKSAFRECTKLSSKIIDRQKDDETQRRLQIWCTIGIDRPYGKYAIDGAKLGTLYGTKNKNNIEMLKKINDFDWLKEQFDARNT